jgi:excinuclease ABC subunit C
MSLTHRLFGMRSCNEVITGQRPRPCLEYDIKRCLAPCVAAICSAERYQQAVGDTRLFLEGRNQELADQLHERMMAAAAEQRYEEAGQLRDAMRTVQTVRERQQKMATSTLGADRDVFGIHIGAEGVAVVVFLLRSGRVVERLELVADRAGNSADEVVQAILEQFYTDQVPAPQVHLPTPPVDADLLETWLSMRAERQGTPARVPRWGPRRVRVQVPQRGDKRGLVDLAQRNAALVYRAKFDARDTAHLDALETLQTVLALPSLPRRIECFDISTFQGRETVASMVVCEDGRMKRGEYRKFRVQGVSIGGRFLDDFAAMKQVVERRYRRVLEQGGPFPDLVVIDGGKGQLNAAYEALESLGLANLVAVGLAKKEELVFTRDREEPIAFDRHGAALRLLQRIRDEAHRFAVSFHRRARTMRDLRSELDAVPGIGPRRRKTLLTTFGSLAGVRRATREELATVVGPKAAAVIIDYFARSA